MNHKTLPNPEVSILLALKVFLKVHFMQILEFCSQKMSPGDQRLSYG